jgi:hypothetical protein
MESKANRFLDWLAGPQFRDPEALSGARLLVRVVLISLSVSIVMEAKYLIEDAIEIAALSCGSIVIQVLALVLSRGTGSFRLGGHVFTFAMWSLFFGIATLSGGIDSPNLIANAFVVVLAPMLLGVRQSLFWLAAVIVTGISWPPSSGSCGTPTRSRRSWVPPAATSER